MIRRPARGMTLVEMMVGLVIGLFLVIVMSSIYLGSKGTFNSQESVSRLQENARLAVDTLSNDLRMGGFHGCAGQTGGNAPVNNTLASPTSVWNNYAQGVAGSHYVGGAWSPSLDPNLAALAPSTAGDVITVYRSWGTAWSLTAEMASGTAALTITPTPNITQGDILVVADCSGAAIFQATNTAPGTGGSIQHLTGVGGVAPGNASANLGRAWLQDATVFRMQAISYYLAPSALAPGLSSLWSYATPGYSQPAAPVELVTGVERMQITYGLDTNGDQAADTFVTADGVGANWTEVVSARIELLLDGPTTNTTSVAQPYVFAGVTTTPTDRRMRSVVTLVASLRNTAP